MKKLREQSLFIIALSFLFIFMACFVFFLLMMLSGNTMSLMKRSVRMIATQILVYTTDNYEIDFTRFKPDIVGIGIYQADGKSLALYGSAPRFIAKDQKEYMDIDESKQTVKVFLRRPDFDNTHDTRFIFAEVDIHDQLQRHGFIRSLSIIAPFFLTVTMLIFIYLYKRNLNYRKKIAIQEQLVHLGEASRTLSHEIKNPLSAIRLQTAYLKRISPKKNHKSIGIIEEEVERLTHLSRRISDFLKDPEGTKEEIEVFRFITDLAAKFSYPITIHSNKTNSVHIRADKERLRSIFENIFKNAIESMRPDQELKAKDRTDSRPIVVDMTVERYRLLIEICDSGSGISEQQKAQLFDPFFTTKPRGSGLGLFIARRFIQALGGKIILANRKSGGTRVTLSIPLRKKA
jgi:signal transduction histidine kinase